MFPSISMRHKASHRPQRQPNARRRPSHRKKFGKIMFFRLTVGCRLAATRRRQSAPCSTNRQAWRRESSRMPFPAAGPRRTAEAEDGSALESPSDGLLRCAVDLPSPFLHKKGPEIRCSRVPKSTPGSAHLNIIIAFASRPPQNGSLGRMPAHRLFRWPEMTRANRSVVQHVQRESPVRGSRPSPAVDLRGELGRPRGRGQG